MDFPKINLHTHSVFSDGKNSIKQMVTVALKLKINYLAITDHFSDSWKCKIIPTLNTAEKIEDYLIKIENCQSYLKTNNKNLRLFKGIEIDLGSSEKVIKKFIRPEHFDIILFEYLETPEGMAYVRNIIEYWKNLKPVNNKFPILGLAHFDPSNFIYQGLDSLIYFLKEFNIYYEFNSSYYECFSRKNELFFKKLKEHKIYVAIGSDAHNLNGLDFIEEPLKMIEIYNLENNFKLFLERLKNI